jgi:hypothetical protein
MEPDDILAAMTAAAEGPDGYVHVYTPPVPLGVTPRFIVDRKRAADILQAMYRAVDAGTEIPQEWYDELQSLERTRRAAGGSHGV